MSISRTANPLRTAALHASTTAVDVPTHVKIEGGVHVFGPDGLRLATEDEAAA